MDYVVVQRANDSGDSRSMGSYLKGGFISQLPDKLVVRDRRGFPGSPSRMTLLFFQHCGGASGRVAEGATAFAQRYAMANMMTVAGWRQGVDDPAEHIAGDAQLLGDARAVHARVLRQRSGARSHRERGQRQLSRQLRAAGSAQEEVRPDQPVPA